MYGAAHHDYSGLASGEEPRADGARLDAEIVVAMFLDHRTGRQPHQAHRLKLARKPLQCGADIGAAHQQGRVDVLAAQPDVLGWRSPEERQHAGAATQHPQDQAENEDL